MVPKFRTGYDLGTDITSKLLFRAIVVMRYSFSMTEFLKAFGAFELCLPQFLKHRSRKSTLTVFFAPTRALLSLSCVLGVACRAEDIPTCFAGCLRIFDHIAADRAQKTLSVTRVAQERRNRLCRTLGVVFRLEAADQISLLQHRSN